MLRNYFVIAIRNFKNQFTYSFINVFGFAIGLACSLIIFYFVYGEWCYDRHFKNANRIYRIGVSFFNMGGFAIGPEILGNTLPKEFDGLEAFTRISRSGAVPIKVNKKEFREEAYYTDSSYFKIFSYSFAHGDPKTALRTPFSIVLTETMAKKFFGNELGLGKTLEIGKKKTPYSVTGIVKDGTFNTHLKSNIWLSMDDQLKNEPIWTSTAFHNYVLLKPNNTQNDLERALDLVIKNHVYPSSWADPSKVSFEEFKKNKNSIKFYVHPLIDVHLKSKLNYELSPSGDEANLYIFGAISIFILTLASVNFINLTTARAIRRAKEVGIRKALGTSRSKLAAQFLIESVMVTTIALIIAFFIGELLIFSFKSFTGESLIRSLWSGGWNLIYILGFATFVGLLAGLYPALYLTSFNPINALKGAYSAMGKSTFRSALVIFQFSISIALIICTVIIFQQYEYIQTKDLGFDPENFITIDRVDLLGKSAETFKKEILQLGGVTGATFHTGEPGSKMTVTFSTYKTPAMEKDFPINTYFGDTDYLDVMGYQIVKGSKFPKGLESDSTAVIINESASTALNLGENAIGAEVNKGVHVIGVVKDFHWESLRNKIAPVVIMLKPIGYQLGVKLKSRSAANFVEIAKKRWNELYPDDPMRYHFMDDNFGDLLKKEQLFGKVIAFFTALAIIISCLGLYGLSAYSVEQHTREIGIRKVFGATVQNIVLMLTKKFSGLIAIAICIGVPISVYLMTRWLEGFAYHVSLQVWMIVLSSAIGLLLAWLTVSYNAFKAASSNPADSLRWE